MATMFENMSQYFGYHHMMRMSKKQSQTVAHQETCPICNRPRVNLYKRNGEWKCRRCWEVQTDGTSN